MNTSDFRFLSDPTPDRALRVIYRYRSGYLKPYVRKRIFETAQAQGAMIQNVAADQLSLSLLGGDGLFGDALTVCDIVSKGQSEDFIEALSVIALNERLNPFCVFVPADNDQTSSEAWIGAAKNALIIDEQQVSKSNVKQVFEFLVQWNGFAPLLKADGGAAFAVVRSFVGDKSWPLDEVAKLVDMAILSPTFARERASRQTSRRGEVLNECVMDFLQDREHLQMRRLLSAVDVMKSEKLRSSADILAELYFATEKAMRGTDKRYQRNKLGLGPPDQFFAWALRLMSSERALLTSPLCAAVERLCRDHMVAHDEEWLLDPSHFKRALYTKAEPETVLVKRRRSLFEAVLAAYSRNNELGSSSNLPAVLPGREPRATEAREI